MECWRRVSRLRPAFRLVPHVAYSSGCRGGRSASRQRAHQGGLTAAKVRGRKLGSPIAAKTVAKARAARSAYAAKANATTLAVIREVQKSGVTSLAGIARTLARLKRGTLRHRRGALRGSRCKCLDCLRRSAGRQAEKCPRPRPGTPRGGFGRTMHRFRGFSGQGFDFGHLGCSFRPAAPALSERPPSLFSRCSQRLWPCHRCISRCRASPSMTCASTGLGAGGGTITICRARLLLPVLCSSG